MAKKKKAEKPRHEPTKRQLSHWQQQKKRQRIVFTAGVSIIAAVVIMMIVGWYVGYYRPLYRTAIRVNDTEFNMKYYVEALDISSKDQPADFIQFAADSAIQGIKQNELIKQGASKLGLSIYSDNIKEELKSADLPASDVYKDLVRGQLLIEKLLDEHFEYQVPDSTEQVYSLAMLLESRSQANEVKNKLENSGNFTQLAGELSLNEYTRTNDGDLGWHPQNILTDLLGTPLPVDHAFDTTIGVVSQPIFDQEIVKGIGYWLIKILDGGEIEEEEAHVQAMLLGSESQAQDVLSRLAAGEAFAALAKEFSQLDGVEDNDGDLGIVVPENMTPAFNEFVFNPDIAVGTLSEPIRDKDVTTKEGYWLIKVLDKEDNRPLEDKDRDYLKAQALDEWISFQWNNPANDIDDSFLDDERKQWAIEQVLNGRN